MRIRLIQCIAFAGTAMLIGRCLFTISASAQTPANLLPTRVQNLSSLPVLMPNSKSGDYTVAPPYSNAAELTANPSVPKGMIYHFVMQSTESKIYPGISKTAPGKVVPYDRNVTVYVPSQYVPGTPAPFLISQDSMGEGQIPTILDNMIYQHRLPVMIAIMIDSGGGDAQGSERGLEYDTVSGRYARFIQNEVLPKVSRLYNVTLTKNPDGRMTMGGSSGGAAAFTMAWFRPDLFHRVLTYSGTFVNQQSPFNPASPHGAWEEHEHLILQTKRKPLRVWLEVGQNDLGSGNDISTLHNWVLANERMAAALKVKHYHYQFVFAQDAGHVDGRVVGETLPEALAWAWKGYPISSVKS